MSKDNSGVLFVVSTIAIAAIILTWRYGSPAATLGLVSGSVWFWGKFSENRWVRAFASSAGALSIGFVSFAFLYVLLAYRRYSDPKDLASISDGVWWIESTLLHTRFFLKQIFDNTWWLVGTLTVTIALALLSPLIGPYGLVSRFQRLQGWLSRLTFALVGATAFTVFLPTDYGKVAEIAHQAVREEIEASLRRTEEDASHALAAKIVRSAIVQFSPQQRYCYNIFFNDLAKWRPSVVEVVVKREAKVDTKKPVNIEEWIWARNSKSAYPDADDGDGRDTLNKVSSLEQKAASQAKTEKRGAIEAVIAAVFTKVTPEIDSVASQFVSILVETVSEPLSKAVVDAAKEASTFARKIRLVGGTLEAKINPHSTNGIVQLQGLRSLLDNGEEIQPDQVTAYAQRVATQASSELRAEEQKRDQAAANTRSFVGRNAAPHRDPNAFERIRRLQEMHPYRPRVVVR